MALPANITKTDLLKAIKKIDKENIPPSADSRYYDVLYKGKKYPPKLVVSYANVFANGEELPRTSFEGGLNTECFKLLEKEGFIIVPKTENEVDPNIFVFTASDIEARKHLDDSIFNPVPIDKIEKHLGPQLSNEIAEKSIDGKIYAWGAAPAEEGKQESNSNKWKKINEGDYILGYVKGNYVCVGRITYKIEHDDLASDIWGRMNDGRTWKYMYFIQKPFVFNPEIPINSLGNYLATRYIGFTRNGDMVKLKAIKDDYGSIEKFISSLTDNFKFKQVVPHSNSSSHSKSSDIMLLTAIKSKPFVILAGFSGTGKSREVRALAYEFCPKNLQTPNNGKPGNFELIKVKPNWHDSSELLGYESRISGTDKYIMTDFVKFVIKAWTYREVPFFLCLDEMNLAPVEQYFAEYLSVIETRRQNNDSIVTDALISSSIFNKHLPFDDFLNSIGLPLSKDLRNQFIQEGLTIPHNLIVMGTVNMDETTHSFSRKVLDRAMTIEMNAIELRSGLDKDDERWSYPPRALDPSQVIPSTIIVSKIAEELGETKEEVIAFLEKINIAMDKSSFKIAYRVRDEFLIFVYNYQKSQEGELKKALDALTLMKILPRIEGDESKVKVVLSNLENLISSYQLDSSLAKINEMSDKLTKYFYTSFWN